MTAIDTRHPWCIGAVFHGGGFGTDPDVELPRDVAWHDNTAVSRACMAFLYFDEDPRAIEQSSFGILNDHPQ